MNKKSLIAAALIALFTGLVIAANNNGDLFSTVVRRPANTEFVRFSFTNNANASVTWTSSLNRVSGFVFDNRATTGLVQTNIMTCTSTGAVFIAVPTGKYEAGHLDVLMVE